MPCTALTTAAQHAGAAVVGLHSPLLLIHEATFGEEHTDMARQKRHSTVGQVGLYVQRGTHRGHKRTVRLHTHIRSGTHTHIRSGAHRYAQHTTHSHTVHMVPHCATHSSLASVQALSAASDMGADAVVLTHFSQRYPKVVSSALCTLMFGYTDICPC